MSHFGIYVKASSDEVCIGRHGHHDGSGHGSGHGSGEAHHGSGDHHGSEDHHGSGNHYHHDGHHHHDLLGADGTALPSPITYPYVGYPKRPLNQTARGTGEWNQDKQTPPNKKTGDLRPINPLINPYPADRPDTHGFMILPAYKGSTGTENNIFMIHYERFQVNVHQYQIVLKSQMDDSSWGVYQHWFTEIGDSEYLDNPNGHKLYSVANYGVEADPECPSSVALQDDSTCPILPVTTMMLPDLANGNISWFPSWGIQYPIFATGYYSKDSPRFFGKIDIEKIIIFHHFGSPNYALFPPCYEYYMWGDEENAYLMHRNTVYPGFQHVVRLKYANLEIGSKFSLEELKLGFLVVFPGKWSGPGAPQYPVTPDFLEKDNSYTAYKARTEAGSQGLKLITLPVERVYYYDMQVVNLPSDKMYRCGPETPV